MLYNNIYIYYIYMMLFGKQLSNTYVFLFVLKFFLAEDFPILILYIHMILHVLT